MGVEIERKYLIKNSDWKNRVIEKIEIKQGYLNSNIERTVRIRLNNIKAFITIKGKTINTSRQEFEYEIPYEEGNSLINMCESPIIEKTRFIVQEDNGIWEIDEFKGENQGLIVAEIELKHENQKFKVPQWIGKEVSNDSRYYNSSLIHKPYKNWKN
jgi:adenylate cyclase